MKKLLIILSLLFTSYAFGNSWNKSISQDDTGKEYQIYSTLSLNSVKGNDTKMALILVSSNKNIFTKIGFAQTEGAISCPNFCQYYIQFDNTASKYTFSIENNSIKLENSQKEDFLKNLQQSKEMILILNTERFYFNVQQPNWSFVSENKNK